MNVLHLEDGNYLTDLKKLISFHNENQQELITYQIRLWDWLTDFYSTLNLARYNCKTKKVGLLLAVFEDLHKFTCMSFTTAEKLLR